VRRLDEFSFSPYSGFGIPSTQHLLCYEALINIDALEWERFSQKFIKLGQKSERVGTQPGMRPENSGLAWFADSSPTNKRAAQRLASTITKR
jgi:hypothetical protein